MQRAWLFFFVVTALALGIGEPLFSTAVASPFIVKAANQPDMQVTTTATLPSAIATAVPATLPTAGTVSQEPNIVFVIALLVIAGGAVLLWRRQKSGREQNM